MKRIFLISFMFLIMFSFVSAVNWDSGLDNGLKDWWTYDDAYIFNTYDQRGFYDIINLTAEPGRSGGTGLTGKMGQSYYHNANNDELGTASMQTGASDWTWVGWIKLHSTAAGDYYFFWHGSASGGANTVNSLNYQPQNGNFIATHFADDVTMHTQTLTNGTWYHVAYVHDQDVKNNSLYLNGAFAGSATNANGVTVGNGNFYLGGDGGTRDNFVGEIDEVGYYNRTLSLSEIEQIYASGAGINPGNTSEVSTSINSPADNLQELQGVDITFNWTSTESAAGLVNTTLFINDTANQTISISGSENTTTATLSFTLGAYNWTVEACSANKCANDTHRSFTISRVIFNSQTFSSPVTEGTPNLFTGNFTADSSVLAVYLNYNNTYYVANSFNVSNFIIGNRSLTSDLVTGTENRTFFWEVNLTDGYTFQTASFNQTISDILVDNCSTYNNTLYNFTIVDEALQTTLNATGDNTYSEVDTTLSLSDGTLLQSYSTSFNQTNPFAICISSNLSTNTQGLFLDAQIQYSADNYVKEFYNIQNENITTADLNTNITLYDLNSSVAQEFLVTYTDQNFNPVQDALILVKRKYISEGVFKTVEIPITDNAGQALVNLVLSDVIYSFTVMKNGELLATFDNQVAFCDNIATGDCSIQLNTYSTTSLPDTFSDVGSYYFDIDYNRTSRELTASFSVSSGDAATNTLNVTLFDNEGASTAVCSDTLITASGSLTCTIPTQYENSTVQVELTKDGDKVALAVLSLNADPDVIYGNSRIFIAIMLFLLVIGLGVVDSPAIMGVFMIIGTILLVAFNLINSGPANSFIGATATGLWYIIAVVLIMIKGGRR